MGFSASSQPPSPLDGVKLKPYITAKYGREGHKGNEVLRYTCTKETKRYVTDSRMPSIPKWGASVRQVELRAWGLGYRARYFSKVQNALMNCSACRYGGVTMLTRSTAPQQEQGQGNEHSNNCDRSEP